MSVPKPPTPQGISALLKRAGFVRAVSKLRGGVSGFSVSKLGAGPEVEVRYSSVTMGTSSEHRLMHLARYARVLGLHGYAVETDASWPRLIVTAAKEQDQ